MNLNGDVRAFAFDSSNKLYALIDAAGPGIAGELYSFDMQTLVKTWVGATGLVGLHSLAFDPEGTLYGWDYGTGLSAGTGLNIISTTNGKVTDVELSVNGTAPSGMVEFLAFGPDGALYGGSNTLYSIAVKTGKLTEIGSGPYGSLIGADFFTPNRSSFSPW